ncbi:MAG: carbon starvation protein A [Marinilabiliaceae bacterium]|nr:carbon starvation protein A [Marinilabiliaceae bacterium]
MITFILSIVVLILGYSIYGKYVEKLAGANNANITPAVKINDGVDFLVLPTWKVFTIEFLNIAGLGPIFGAVLGAMYGPLAYVWIVFGAIFFGAVHDYFSGMLSIKHNGASIPEIVGHYLGKPALVILRIFTLILLVFVGVAFVSGPAELLDKLTGGGMVYWIYGIFAYYLIATLLPINKIIGKIYPIFGGFLLLMALGIFIAIVYLWFSGQLDIVELTVVSMKNYHHNPDQNILFPMMFVVISCGAISGFHSTQAPMMARCVKKETDGRRVFYGAMIAEGIVALIWATAAMNFFGGPNGLNDANYNGMGPAVIVDSISKSWLGTFGAIVAIIGVVVCPITTGDTAFRSARLIVADAFKIPQASIVKRLLISIPLFVVGFTLSKIEFSVIWKYLGLSNQILSVIVLWTIAVYLKINKKNHWLVSVPAAFMTSVCISYFLVAPNVAGGIEMNEKYGILAGIVVSLILLLYFAFYHKNK